MDFVIHPRAEWGARPPSQPLPVLQRPVKTVYVHHEGALFTSLDMDDELAHMRALQADTMKRGYSDFPYHMAVFPSGRIYEGRDNRYEGGATYTQNEISVALLWPGNYDTQTVTKAQLLASSWVITHWITAGICIPSPFVIPHNKAPGNSTACPGVHGTRAVSTLRSLVSTTPPTMKVKPMYDPSLGPIAAVWQDSSGKVLAAVSPDGDVYAWGVPFRPWPNKATDFAGRKAAKIGQAAGLPAGRYTVTATSGETYTP